MSNPNKSLTNQRQLLQKCFLINSKDKFEKELKTDSDVVFYSLKEFVQQQKEYGEKYSNNVLGISSIIEDQKRKTITVTYDCAVPLSQIRYSSPKHKIQIFKHLYLIYGFLNKENILHRNLKPNNIILYNQQLLLTDFGYKGKNWIIDNINFMDNKDGIQENMYPYLSPEIADIIVSTNTFGHKRDFLKGRHQLSVKQQDQFAIAIMMLEVFIPLKNRKTTTTYERQVQINNMNLSDEFSNEDEKFIKETLLDLLYYKDFNESDFQNKLKMIHEIEEQIGQQIEQQIGQQIEQYFGQQIEQQIGQQIENYKINKQDLMTEEYDYLVKEVLENKDTLFDLKLLYHFNITNLIDCQSIANNQENMKLIEEIKRFQLLYSQIDDLSLDTTEDHINQLTNEDLFILLVYLDQKIENFQNFLNQFPYLMLTEQEQQYLNLKKSLKNQYQKLNNLSKNQFAFNNIFADFIPIYKINDQSNDYTSQQNLLDAVKCIFKNPTLQIYFEINKYLLLQRQNNGWIYKHKHHPNVIYLGEIKENVFEGEVMQFQEEENIKMISHYVSVQIQLSSWNIQDKEKNSSIFYYIERRTPEKFQKVKEYSGQIKNGKKDGEGTEKDFIENMLYIGYWDEDYMSTFGTQELINYNQILILQNAPYRWEGNFKKNKLHGQNIKTYLLNNNNQEVWLEGSYKDGQKRGFHVCYMKSDQQVQTVRLYRSLFFVFLNKELEFKLSCN